MLAFRGLARKLVGVREELEDQILDVHERQDDRRDAR
jgi:hypothetical protein